MDNGEYCKISGFRPSSVLVRVGEDRRKGPLAAKLKIFPMLALLFFRLHADRPSGSLVTVLRLDTGGRVGYNGFKR